jgi:hypothetical protein
MFGYATLCRWASISDVSKDLRALIFSVKKAARLTLYCAPLTLLELRTQRHRLEDMHPQQHIFENIRSRNKALVYRQR